MKTQVRVIALVGLVAYSLALVANDWPQWRGPQRTGVSKETGLLKEWPAGGPKLIWQVKDMGLGYSTPSVAGDRIYLLANNGMEDEFVQALDAKDGKRLWKTTLGKVGPNRGPQYPAARSTPTVDGAQLFALGSDGDLACVETASGKIKWQKNLRKEFGGQPGVWAYAESPLIDGDVLVCTPGGSKATVVALQKNTGDVIWTSSISEGEEAAYASIVIGEVDGIKQYIQFLGKGLVGIEAKSGKVLWRYNKTSNDKVNVQTPIFLDNSVISVNSKRGAARVRLKRDGDNVEAEEVFFTPELQVHVGGVVQVGGYVYGASNQALVCLDAATGEVKWQARATGKGSVCYADGHIYHHASEAAQKYDVTLVEATPEAYKEKGRFTPPDPPERDSNKSPAWAHPVVANGRLYIRDLGTIWCYDVKAN
jgi:outer membrane protein assembly factor BamB